MAIAGIPEITLEKTALPYIEKPLFDSLQQEALDHSEGSLLVTGNAGTGKTTVLAESVINKVLSGISSLIITSCSGPDNNLSGEKA